MSRFSFEETTTNTQSKKKKSPVKKIVTIAGSAVVLIVGISIGASASPGVDRGMTGFVWDNASGGFTNEVIHQGWNMFAINPFTSHVIQYPTQNMTYTMSRVNNEGDGGDTSIQFTSKDNQTGNIDVTVQWAVNPKKVEDVYNKYGSDVNGIESGVIHMYAKSAINKAAANYDILDIHGGQKSALAAEATKYLEDSFANDLHGDFVLVSSIQIGQDYLPSSVQQFVNAKIKAETEQQIAQTKLVQSKTDAQQAVVKAQADAEAAKTKADADLYVAEQQAKANKSLSTSLTPEVIQYDFVQKIQPGVLPQYWGVGAGSVLDIAKSGK
jgi:regulator of protease activity HflC (stomatin/prohibitin superfamily)